MKKNNKLMLNWAIKATFITLFLSAFFSLASQYILSKTGFVFSVIICIVFILINCVTDTIGMSVSNSDLKPFLFMASKKEKGALECIKLIKNADKISNICSDIIGDICGIMSGAVGATISLLIAKENLWIAVLVSSIISGLTVFFKAIGKNLAINNSIEIVRLTGKILSKFTRE